MSKIALVTGGTGGIGRVAAEALVRRGYTVGIVGRHPAATAKAIGATAFAADFASLAEVRDLAGEVRKRFDRLDVLVNNAGAIYARRQLSRDGYEMTFAVNHLAPFLLTRELLPMLNPGARVINVASEASRGMSLDFGDLQAARKYFAWKAYGRSKLANILFTRELASRLPGVDVNALHPGLVSTGFGGGSWINTAMRFLKPFARTPEQGAQTTIWLADEAPAGTTGKYFVDKKEKRPTRGALDPRAQQQLWAESEKLVGAALAQARASA